MIISRHAKEQYLNRELDNWAYVKKLVDNEITKLLTELNPKPVFYTEPMTHQKACFLLGVILPQFLFLLSMGAGKTKIMLDIFRYRKKCGDMRNALVLVPNVVTIDSWVQQAQEHAPDLKVVGLYGSTTQRYETLETQAEHADLLVLNYQGLVYMCTNAPIKKSERKEGDRKGRCVSLTKVKHLGSLIDGLIFDEIHNLKSNMSLAFNICDRLAGFVKVRYGLTGTPFGRDPHDLWTQFKVIDGGDTFGNTMALFRACFFYERQSYWGSVEYKFRKPMRQRLHNMLNHRAIHYGLHELGIPKAHTIKVSCGFPETDNAKAYYNKYVEDLINSSKDQEVDENKRKSNIFMKLRQISSGFLYLYDEDEPDEQKRKQERQLIKFPSNPKLELLLSLIAELPEDEKFLVFHEFIPSGEIIAEALQKEKINVARVWGGVKDKVGEVRKFQSDPTCRALVANSKSGGTGINVQMARYSFFYESPTSPITRSQAEGRTRRKGQKSDKVIFYDLCMRKTVDEKILEYIAEGKDLFDAIVGGKVFLEKV